MVEGKCQRRFAMRDRGRGCSFVSFESARVDSHTSFAPAVGYAFLNDRRDGW
jgi:hypothetical protein